MAVIIETMDIPEECGGCLFFYYDGVACTGPGYYMGARCLLAPPEEGPSGRKSPFGGCIGEDISGRAGYGGRACEKHCVEKGKRAGQCPLREA